MTDLHTDVADSLDRIFRVPAVVEEWDAVLDRAGERPRRRAVGFLHLLRRRSGRTALAFAIVAVAAVATLFVSAPWTSSPGFLERAQAALTPPEGSILHYRWEDEVLGDSGCATARSNEIWIDQTPPHTHRAFLSICGGPRREFGGAFDRSPRMLEFVPPNRFVETDLVFESPPDLAASLREAIRNGRAHVEGRTELDGRTVVRIRFVGCSDAPCDGARRGYVYVDAETFAPVQLLSPGGHIGTDGRHDLIVRFPTFEYLPRTDANLALTDIRAQHPDATGP